MLGKRVKLGRFIEELSVGETFLKEEKMEDRELLLYLGLTDDANPLYIQHDYTAQTPVKKPIVPSIMLSGMITSTISKHFPGPGSQILSQSLQFIHPVYHYETIEISLKILELNQDSETIKIGVVANKDNRSVIKGEILVRTPYRPKELDEYVFQNF
ncbi:enoyl-CoA hydratase [Priestia filamentosa]|uniref:MaoC/PaaZ C-terminal domain-containing protein n=1 Tax=Priestia filamentosa TaxID=1402861 RepID=UPI001FB39E89|nr:MaoC/PaaZ C-terminal domain-containing protein [Priestia filamentosa]UOE61170.1 enoyl-CoA hydratase [Priestia filamentosa]